MSESDAALVNNLIAVILLSMAVLALVMLVMHLLTKRQGPDRRREQMEASLPRIPPRGGSGTAPAASVRLWRV